MTTEQKVTFLTLAQRISGLNAELLELASQLKEGDEVAEDVLQASAKLIQAQNNLMKAVK